MDIVLIGVSIVLAGALCGAGLALGLYFIATALKYHTDKDQGVRCDELVINHANARRYAKVSVMDSLIALEEKKNAYADNLQIEKVETELWRIYNEILRIER